MTSSSRDPWEGDVWEDVGDEEGLGEFNYDHVNPADAGKELADYLIFLKTSHKLSAVSCSILAYWASKAGACGFVNELAMAPGKESHRYSRHLDAKLGLMDKSKYYPLSLPLNARMSASRVVENVWSQPLQDAFQKMIDAMDDVRTTLADGVAAGFVPPSYHTHPVVANAGINEIVLPLMLYVDGVPITRRDGCVGFVLRCILPPRKPYLVLVLRKEDMCKCGCRGWCTLHVVHLWLQWGFKALANGRNPTARHDGTEFGLDEAPRAAVANQEFSKGGLIIKGACILLKGDLKELSSTWGLPDTSSHDAPCGLCCKSGQDFLNFRDFSPLAMPDPPKTFDVYNSACERCEIWTPVLDWRCFWQMRGSLKQDRREQGPRGRCLIVDMPELGLLKSDRLGPSVDLSDIYVIDTYIRESYVPQSFLFWRRSEETHTRHRCILFNDAELGITLYKSLAMDFLHCVSKGVYSFFCDRFLKQFLNPTLWELRRVRMMWWLWQLCRMCDPVYSSGTVTKRRQDGSTPKYNN